MSSSFLEEVEEQQEKNERDNGFCAFHRNNGISRGMKGCLLAGPTLLALLFANRLDSKRDS